MTKVARFNGEEWAIIDGTEWVAGTPDLLAKCRDMQANTDDPSGYFPCAEDMEVARVLEWMDVEIVWQRIERPPAPPFTPDGRPIVY